MIAKIPLNSLPRLAKTTGLPNAESSLKEISAQIKAEHGDTYTHVEVKDFLDLRTKYQAQKTEPSSAGVCSMLDAIIRAMQGEPVASKSDGGAQGEPVASKSDAGASGAAKNVVVAEANALIQAAKPAPKATSTSRVAESMGDMIAATLDEKSRQAKTVDGRTWVAKGKGGEKGCSGRWETHFVESEDGKFGVCVKERASGKAWVIVPWEPLVFLAPHEGKSLLAGISQNGFCVWNLSTGDRMAWVQAARNEGGAVLNESFSFSPNGSQIAYYDSQCLTFWSSEGEHLNNFGIRTDRPIFEWSEETDELLCYGRDGQGNRRAQPDCIYIGSRH